MAAPHDTREQGDEQEVRAEADERLVILTLSDAATVRGQSLTVKTGMRAGVKVGDKIDCMD